jgi:hypothetical protein
MNMLVCRHCAIIFGATITVRALFPLTAFAQASPQPSSAESAGNGLSVSWPAHIDISPASATNFDRFNEDIGTIIVFVKCDGTKSAIIPPTPDIDDALRSSLANFVQEARVTVGSGCHDKMFLVGFHVPSGAMTEVEASPPPR